jgi:hypothetical protein
MLGGVDGWRKGDIPLIEPDEGDIALMPGRSSVVAAKV